MVLRDKRVWWGVVVAVILAFVSYSVVSGLGKDPGKDVSQQSLKTGEPVGSTTTTPLPAGSSAVPAGQATIPAVVGERLNQAREKLTALGLTNVKTEDVTGQNRVVLDDNNWIVEVQDPAAETVVDTHTQIVLKVRKPSDAHSPQSTPFGTVPDVVCANLQDAQDALRSSGFLVLTSSDGSGRKRAVLLDRNWVVIAQSAEPGSRPSLTTHIVLTVVKYGEPTKDSDCET
jgi:beta-lactam-binding protein with PASTA domain